MDTSPRRLAIVAGIVALAGLVGLLAGQWTANGKGTSQIATDPDAEAVAEYETRLGRDVEALRGERAAKLKRLRAARTPAQQAAASADLARVHARAAKSLARAPVPPAVRQKNESLVVALTRVANAYRRLAAGAAQQDRSKYDGARRDARDAEKLFEQRIRAS